MCIVELMVAGEGQRGAACKRAPHEMRAQCALHSVAAGGMCSRCCSAASTSMLRLLCCITGIMGIMGRGTQVFELMHLY